MVRLKWETNFSEFFLALEYSVNLNIIIAHEIIEKISSRSIAIFPTIVASLIRWRKLPDGFAAEADNIAVDNKMCSIY